MRPDVGVALVFGGDFAGVVFVVLAVTFFSEDAFGLIGVERAGLFLPFDAK